MIRGENDHRQLSLVRPRTLTTQCHRRAKKDNGQRAIMTLCCTKLEICGLNLEWAMPNHMPWQTQRDSFRHSCFSSLLPTSDFSEFRSSSSRHASRSLISRGLVMQVTHKPQVRCACTATSTQPSKPSHRHSYSLKTGSLTIRKKKTTNL